MANTDIPRVLASVPVYTAVTPEPYIHHLTFSQETGRAEMRGEYSVRWMCSGPKDQIRFARNAACSIAVAKKADWLLFIDDDMLVPKDLLAKLLAHNVPIVAPIFFRSGGNHDPLVFKTGPDGLPVSIHNYPVDSLFEAPAGVGTGVMLIKREVLEAVGEPWFTWPDNEAKGMDLEFCRCAREKGFKSYCDSSILVQQMQKATPVGFAQWMARREDYKNGQG